MTEWYGYLPEGWQISRLKYLVNQTADHAESNTGYIGLENIESWSGKYQKKGDSSFEAEGVSLKIRKGDIIFGKLRPYLAKCYLAEKDACCSTEFIVMTPNKINPVFLKYLLLSPKFIDEINMSTYGSKMPRANWDFIGNTFIPLPILEEQKIIADYVDNKVEEINNLIEEAKVSIEEYKAWKASIIYEAVTKGLDKDVEMKDSYNQLIGIIPAHWKVSTLSALSDNIQNGYVGPTRDLFVDTGVKYIQSLHIKEGNILFDRHPYYVRNEWAEKHPKIHKGDVLIVQTGDIGQVGLVNEEYDNCNCHALIIVSLNKQYVYPEFIKYYFMNPNGKEILLSYQTGALLPHLNAGRIKAASICYPSINEQKRIVQYLDEKSSSIDALISEKESLISDLEEYKKSLIFEVVTGKRKVV